MLGAVELASVPLMNCQPVGGSITQLKPRLAPELELLNDTSTGTQPLLPIGSILEVPASMTGGSVTVMSWLNVKVPQAKLTMVIWIV